MSDLDLTEFLEPVQRGPRCGVRRALERLEDGDRTLIADALAHPDAVSRRIAGWLAEHIEGSTPSKETVDRHRRGDCRCPRPSDD